MAINKIEGGLPCREGRFAIVVSRFNSFICERLVDGALDVLKRQGEVPDENITTIITCGCVIRGSTYHFEVVSNECAKGLTQVTLETGVVITNGVLTTDNLDQAVQRAGSKMGNKGAEAAAAALELVNVLKQI